jgi:perosamine synthetase
MTMIPYGRQSIDGRDISAVVGVLKSDWLTQGPAVKRFEEALCRYTGAQYAVAVANGTVALQLAVRGLGLGPGDRLLTSPVTFAASANCAVYVGAKPGFVDIDDKTYHIDLQKLADLLKDATKRKGIKVVIPVHLMGTVVDMKRLRDICAPHGVKIVEDAAHAIGACYTVGKKNYKVGSCAHSDAVIFSFHPIKNMTTGEGGAVLTNDPEVYRTLLRLRHHGIDKNTKTPSKGLASYRNEPWFYDIPEVGFNFRLTDIHSALGLSQLKKLDGFLRRRRQLVDRYNKAFAGTKDIRTPYERPGTKAGYHLYVIRVPSEKRNGLFRFLKDKGIVAQINYIPVHLFSAYEKLGFRRGNFPVAEKYFEECLSLPLYPGLSDAQQKRVIDAVRGFLKA